MEENVKLTKLAKCAGCGAKVGAGVLAQLLDRRHAPSADDVQMMEYLHFHRIPFVVALTKADKLKKSEMTAQLEEFRITCAPYGCKQVFLTSAEKGTGVEELRQYLDACLAPEA